MAEEAVTASSNKRSRSDDEEEIKAVDIEEDVVGDVSPPAKIQKNVDDVEVKVESEGQEEEKIVTATAETSTDIYTEENVVNKDDDELKNDAVVNDSVDIKVEESVVKNNDEEVENDVVASDGGNGVAVKKEESSHNNNDVVKEEEKVVSAKAEEVDASALEELVEERGEVSAQYVGRVIGKGGEMIRDLQARSGCRIDVDQNVPESSPRTILYRGTQKTIDFAKELVSMLCAENGKEAELPLGEATRKVLNVPANVIGKIIGRGGEMIRELQNKSQAKIQVDHSGSGAGTPGGATRQVTLTGTDVSVVKAEEMINFLTSNPALDATIALNMLLEEKNKHDGKWGTGPPYTTMPNNGAGMQPQQNNTSHTNNQHQGQYNQNYSNSNNPSYTNNASTHQQYTPSASQTSPAETEIFPCPKLYMGRVIGQKGITVNDLQNRSGCDIQINQDVPPGHDCQITLRGSRQGIDHSKQMLKEIIDLGPNHPYAGGRGGGGGGGGGVHHHPQQQHDPSQQGYNNNQYPNNNAPPNQYYSQQQQQRQPQNYTHYPNNNNQYQNNNPPQQAYPQQTYNPPQQQQQNYNQQQQYPPQYQYQQQQQQQQQQQFQQQPQMHYNSPQMNLRTQVWKSATAADGQVYYYNEKTGETQWDKPPGF